MKCLVCFFKVACLIACSDLLCAKNFKSSVQLKVLEKTVYLYPDTNILKKRVFYSENNPLLEPVFILIPTKKTSLFDFVSKFSLKGMEKRLFHYLSAKVKSCKKCAKSAKIRVDKTMWSIIKKNKLKKFFRASHKKVEILSFDSDSSHLEELLKQTNNYLSYKERKKLAAKFKKGQPVLVDKYLLPHFPRNVLKGFSLYKGPNCFHASMAFHSDVFAHSRYYNVRKEKNHHIVMINNDELYRILHSEFYEIKSNATLNYGDVLVFLDLPGYLEKSQVKDWFHYRWIKHASTFLFNKYSFSKKSKSSNSPYSVKILSEEWDYWKSRLGNPTIKIFRRSQKHVRKFPTKVQGGWVY